jgi:hypothetical protein
MVVLTDPGIAVPKMVLVRSMTPAGMSTIWGGLAKPIGGVKGRVIFVVTFVCSTPVVFRGISFDGENVWVVFGRSAITPMLVSAPVAEGMMLPAIHRKKAIRISPE